MISYRIGAIAISLVAALPVTATSSPSSAIASEIQPASLSPEQQRDQRAESYLLPFETGNAEEFVDWYRRNTEKTVDAAELSQKFGELHDDWGRLRPMGIMAPGPDQIMIEARTNDGGKVALVFDFEPEAPFLVREVTHRYTPPPPPIKPPANWTNLQELADFVRDASDTPALGIGIYKGGKQIVAMSGVREVGKPDAAQITDGFHWASVGKSVTGAMIASLVEDGTLEWDTTMGDVFGAQNVHPDYVSVPLWMLAAHQAGVPTHTDFDMSFDEKIAGYAGDDFATKRANYIDEMLRQAPDYKPGTDAEYSNGGYMVAGRMAEIVTGQSWEDLVQQRVLSPLGMTSSTPMIGTHGSSVAGHMAGPNGNIEAMNMDGVILIPRIIAPAGGIQGSIVDLTTFSGAHVRGLNGQDATFASSNTVRQLHSQQPGQKPFNGEDYSFGWGDRCVIDVPEGIECRSHNGGNGTFFAQTLLIPELDLALTLVANDMKAGLRALKPAFDALLARYATSPIEER